MFLRGLPEKRFALLTRGAGVSEKAPEPLHLSADPQRRRTGYAYPIPHYCSIYETNERGIKVWLKKGRDASDPVPLDDPQAMPAWWTRNSPQVVPSKLIVAAQRAAATAGAASAPALPTAAAPSTPVAPSLPPGTEVHSGPPPARPPPSPPPAAPPAPRSSVVLDASTEGLTLADALPRLQRVLSHALLDYEAKASAPTADEASITLAANRLDKVLERHRKLEITLIESAQKRGDLVAVLELRTQLAAVFARLSGTLVDYAVTELGISRPAAIAFVDGWFAQVRDLPFGDTATARLPEAEARAA